MIDARALDAAVRRFRRLVTMARAYDTDDERRKLLTRGRVSAICDEYEHILTREMRRGA